MVAEKISAVIMNFELNDKNELTLNSKPVELGISSIQVNNHIIIPHAPFILFLFIVSCGSFVIIYIYIYRQLKLE